MVHEFQDTSVLVVGASGLMGGEIAAAFARAGARVMLSDIDGSGAEGRVEELRGEGCDVAFHRADVTDAADVHDLLRHTLEALGGIDVVVNAADVRVFGPAVDVREERWKAKIEVAFKPFFLLFGGVARHWIEEGRTGRMISISSTESTIPYPGSVAESAAKAGVDILTRVMACELGPSGITVNAIAPGMTRKRQEDPGFSAEYIESYMHHIPLGRAGEEREIVDAVFFLASSAGSYVNGQTLVVDGGYSAGIPALQVSGEPPTQWLGFDRDREGV